MVLKTGVFGDVKCEVYIDKFSAVDSYIESARLMNPTHYKYPDLIDSDGEFTDLGIDRLNQYYEAEVQEYAYGNGSSNHN